MGDIWIIYNDLLTGLSGLENLTFINGDILIRRNYSLNSLSGLDNIGVSTIGNLFIYENDSLITCDVESVCNYMNLPWANAEIHDNAPGCNSPKKCRKPA